ncbi:restriction endonuclease subunit S [Caldifermentibacillus hisashii]|uniref:restriction endonuclease subunit S n=1 Tax=Caldifermentibacillus hisashii TaxID=996558 RepID=UPI0030D690A0
MVFDKWNECSLGELANLKYGKTIRKKELSDDGYPVFSGYAIVGYLPTFDYEEPQLIIVCRGVGGTGDIKLSPAKSSITNLSIIIDSDPSKIDKSFLYWYLKHADTHSLRTGSAQPQIVIKDLEKFKIKIPPMSEQKAIANILSTLDEKIETNNQINEKLEEMAQAIFKHWFVDFEFPNENGEPYKSSGGEMVESELGMIPKGWRVVKLKEIIEFIKNSTKPGEQLNNRKYVPIDTMPIKKLILNSYKSYKEAKSSLILFEKYDILIGAMRVYFHRVNLAPFRGVTRTTTFVLRSKSLEDISYNLLLLNMPSTISYADQSSIGSTIPYAVWEGGLGEMLLAQPPIEIRKKFNNVIFPLLEKMILNSQQNIRIQKIRDTLLPKLMSGEIRVPVEEEK